MPRIRAIGPGVLFDCLSRGVHPTLRPESLVEVSWLAKPAEETKSVPVLTPPALAELFASYVSKRGARRRSC